MSGRPDGLAHLERTGRGVGLDSEVAALADRYRAGPSPDPSDLHADADVLRSAAAVMRAHLLAQEQAIARLGSAWTGTAADTALGVLRDHLDRARDDCAGVLAAADALDEAATLIADAHRERNALADEVFAERDGVDDAWSPAVVAGHVVACVRALTDLATAVEGVIDGARSLVAGVVDAVCAVPAEPVAPPANVASDPVVVAESSSTREPAWGTPESVPPGSVSPESVPPGSVSPEPALSPTVPHDHVQPGPASPEPAPVSVAGEDGGAFAVGPAHGRDRDARSGGAVAVEPVIAAGDSDGTGAELAGAGPL